MNIILIRHGETEANIKANAPPILTIKGKKQIDALARRLKNSKIDVIFSSDLERASLTAREIHKYNPQAKLVETEELQEIYRLIIGGPAKEGISPNRFEENMKRAENFWKKMLKWKYKNVAVVCHGNIIRFFLSKAIRAPPECFYKIEIYPTSVSIINIKYDESKVVLINDIAHIPKELLSNNSIYVE